jgi:hypothetical protein
VKELEQIIAEWENNITKSTNGGKRHKKNTNPRKRLKKPKKAKKRRSKR